MTRTLLKASDNSAQASVRPFSVHTASMPKVVPAASGEASSFSSAQDETTLDLLPNQVLPDTRARELEAHIAELEAQLQRVTAKAEALEADGYQRGLRDGSKKADERVEERLQLLSEIAQRAVDQFSARFEQFEVLTLEIAQTALARIFGDHNQFADMAAASVRHQFSQLDESLVLRLRVSPDDFSDKASLASLSRQLREVEIVCDSALSQGRCVFDLTLGQMEVGIPEQWARLQALLARLSDADTAP